MEVRQSDMLAAGQSRRMLQSGLVAEPQADLDQVSLGSHESYRTLPPGFRPWSHVGPPSRSGFEPWSRGE